MQVETFECQETITEPVDASEEAIRLIESMQLGGQLSLVRPKTEDSTAARCPYRKIRGDEQFVYRLLCPQSASLERFAECPIPLRVLQIAAHAKSLEMFDEFEVWSATGEVKDPVLIAQKKTGSWQYDIFILARWGDVLDEWGILVTKAMEKWRAKVRAQLTTIRAEIAVDEQKLDAMSLDRAAVKEGGVSYSSL